MSTLHLHERGTGVPLVFVHGFPHDGSVWTPQLEGLSDTFRVIAPDLPGFGSTPQQKWGIDDAANLLNNVLDALTITEPIILGGVSMGGYIAMAFARQFPQRLRGLILADTRAEPDDAAGKEGRAKMIALANEKGSEAVAEAMLPKMVGATTHASRPLIVETVRTLMERQPTAAVVNAIEALRDRPDATPGLKEIKVPTLVVVGAEDAITPPPLAETLAKGIAGAKLVTIEQAGHLAHLERPDIFNTAVRDMFA